MDSEQAFCPRCEGHGRVYRPHNGPERPALIGRFTEPGNYLLCPDCDGTGELTDGETEQAFRPDPLTVPCPYCGSARGVPCRSGTRSALTVRTCLPHAARRNAEQEAYDDWRSLPESER